MRLNMWMVANRLNGWDFQAKLRGNMPQVLHGARLVYAPNCIYMTQEGKNVRCAFDEEYIILLDIDLKYAFELVQGIFDAYDDWYVRIVGYAKENNWQALTEEVSYMLGNPVIFFDGNNRVMGIFPADSEGAIIDEEWNYLVKHGVSSPQMMRIGKKKIESAKKDWKYILIHPSEAVRFSHLNARIGTKEENTYGFLVSLAVNREFNDGDIKLMTLVCGLLEPAFALYCSTNSDIYGGNCFISLLKGENADSKTVELQMKYYRFRPEDRFCIYVVQSMRAEDESEGELRMLKQNLLFQCALTPMIEIDSRLAVIADIDNGTGNSVERVLEELCGDDDFQVGKSLKFENLQNMRFYYLQAVYAFHCKQEKNSWCHSFYQHAVDYILTCMEQNKMFYACQPEISRLFRKQDAQSRDLLKSLEMYLRYERSLSQAAAQLYVHKNTLLYRIQKIEEACHCDLSDPYEREYIFLSLRVLKLTEVKGSN